MSKTHDALAVASALARFTSELLERWRLLLMLGLIFSPMQPHLRLDYDYRTVQGEQQVIGCNYWSVYGFAGRYSDKCPSVRLLPVDPWWREWL